MKITQITAENYKRVTLATINFEPTASGVVALMGPNESGKSSTLDAFEALIAGRKAPKVSKPIHKGAAKGRIVATFQEDDGTELVVERVYTDKGTTITVRQNGLKVAKADDILARLYSHVALDPLAFANLDSEKQAQTLLRLVGFDPAELDEKRANLYATRTDVGRDVKRLTGQLDGFPPAAEVGERIDIAATAAELDRGVEQHQAADRLRASADAALQAHGDLVGNVEQAREALARTEATLADWSTTLVEREAAADAAEAARPDLAPLRERIATAEQHNAAIAEQERRATVAGELATTAARFAELTTSIEAVDVEKRKGFEEHPMPVPGLTIDEDGEVLLDGTPFSQTSAGCKLRTSVAIAMALAPHLRAILIRDGSLLDQRNRDIIDQLARDNDFTVLMEIVDENAPAGVVFEDGHIAREVTA